MSASAASHMPTIGFIANKFTLHNATPEEITIRWAGLQFTLPPVDALGTRAAHYDTGEPIPGTCVLQDAHCPDRDGMIPGPEEPPNWLAFEAIRNVLGVNTHTKEATGVIARAGVSFLPANPTREVVSAVRANGEQRYAEYMVEWADACVAGYQRAVELSKQHGVIPPPPSADYAKAVMILEKHNEKVRISISQAQRTLEEQVTAEEVELEAFIQAEALVLAKRAAAGKEISEEKLAEELLQKPNVRNYLKRQYSIRKRGYLDVPSPEPPEDPAA